MTDRQQQIIFYALNKALEQWNDPMLDEIGDEIIESVKEFDVDLLLSIQCNITYKLRHGYFSDGTGREKTEELLLAVDKEIMARRTL